MRREGLSLNNPATPEQGRCPLGARCFPCPVRAAIRRYQSDRCRALTRLNIPYCASGEKRTESSPSSAVLARIAGSLPGAAETKSACLGACVPADVSCAMEPAAEILAPREQQETITFRAPLASPPPPPPPPPLPPSTLPVDRYGIFKVKTDAESFRPGVQEAVSYPGTITAYSHRKAARLWGAEMTSASAIK